MFLEILMNKRKIEKVKEKGKKKKPRDQLTALRVSVMVLPIQNSITATTV